MKAWSPHGDKECRECKGSVVPHHGGGLCHLCYYKGYYRRHRKELRARMRVHMRHRRMERQGNKKAPATRRGLLVSDPPVKG